MRCTFLVITTAFLLIVKATSAQNVEWVNSILWSGVDDVNVVGRYAYRAFANRLLILDVSNVALPSSVNRMYLQDEMCGIDISGCYICGLTSRYNPADL